jgi:BirA family biotin operon repressor/biotin-[acetyl-CoA-carboxylase] ligase
MTGFCDQLTSTSLRVALAQHPLVTEMIYRRRLGSTNDLVKRRAGEGAPEGLLVVADEQTAGRGRMRRTWWAPAGSALLTSLLFRPSLSPNQAQQLTMLCALAAADAITTTTAQPVDLKWPNDLTVRGRKIAGLLTESASKADRLDFVVVGLGINVNMDLTDAPKFIAPVTSLRLELGHPVDRLALLMVYLDGVARRYTHLKGGESPYDEWASRLVTLGQPVTAHLGNQTLPGGSLVPVVRRPDSTDDFPVDASTQQLSGLAQGVDPDGALLLRTADGTVHRLFAADVSLRNVL